MNKLIALTTIALTFSLQTVALSQDSSSKMPQEEFAQFVCAYIEAMGTEAAVDAVKAEAMSLFSEQQIETLDELKESDQAKENLCGSLRS